MECELLIYGAGGHGRIVLDVARLSGFAPIVIVDAAPMSRRLDGLVVLDESEVHWDLLRSFKFVCAVGGNGVRAELFARCCELGGCGIGLRHPSAIVAERIAIIDGTVVCAGAVINPGATIGGNCIINTSASVDHDCRIGDHVHICPGVRLGGNVTVGDRTMIGIGSSVIQGIRIGARCVIGAGSVVVRDVPDDSVAFGVPARVRRVNS